MTEREKDRINARLYWGLPASVSDERLDKSFDRSEQAIEEFKRDHPEEWARAEQEAQEQTKLREIRLRYEHRKTWEKVNPIANNDV